MTRKKKTKLALTRRAVRTLSDRQLDRAAGGYVATGESALYEDPPVDPLTKTNPTGTTSLRHQTGVTGTH